MSAAGYDTVTVASLDQFEIEVSDEGADPAVTLFIATDSGQKIALEFPASAWAEIVRATEATKQRFPRGRIEH